MSTTVPTGRLAVDPPRGERDRRARGAGLVVVAGFVLLTVAWAGGNPPGASPDEPAHLVKAYAVGDGQIRGEPHEGGGGARLEDERSLAWFEESGRSYWLPAGVVPPGSVACFAFDPEQTAGCQDLTAGGDGPTLAATHVGIYNPLPYAPAGLAMRGADDYREATWRGRLAGAALSCAFLAWAALLATGDGGSRWSVVGIALAASPAVLFLAASVTTNGVEAASAVCLWAALLRIRRAPTGGGGQAWAAVAVSGATLALSRPLGAALLVAVLAVWVVLVGGAPLREITRASARHVRWTGAVLVAAFVASAGYSALAMPHPPLDLGLAARAVGDAVTDLPDQARQLVGLFGWNDTQMPVAAYVLAFAALTVVGALALVRARPRERAALVVLAAVLLAADIGIAVLIEAQIGFGMQARYVLPLAVGLPMLACDALRADRERHPRPAAAWLPTALLASTAIVHLVAFVANLHRYAVGTSAGWFPPWDAGWRPVGGPTVWIGFAVTGSLALVVAAVAVAPAGDRG